MTRFVLAAVAIVACSVLVVGAVVVGRALSGVRR